MQYEVRGQSIREMQMYALVDDDMHDRAHVVSHAHGSAQEDNVIEKGEGANIISVVPLEKLVEKPRKHEQLVEQCLGKMRESCKQMMESLKPIEDIKSLYSCQCKR